MMHERGKSAPAVVAVQCRIRHCTAWTKPCAVVTRGNLGVPPNDLPFFGEVRLRHHRGAACSVLVSQRSFS